MHLSPSAHRDTFARDHLPPAEQWPALEFTTEALQYPDRLNAATEIIDVPVATFGADRPALRTPDGDVWTYGDLQRRANQIAQVLVEDLGLVPGNRVLLRSPNNPWTVAAWLGVLKAGGIVVTTIAALRARELAPIVEKAQPSIALVDHRYVADVQTLRETVAPRLAIVTFGGPGAGDLAARAEGKSGQFSNVLTAADDVALFCPTSGSTGVPKITTHFHRDVLSIDNTFGRAVLRLEARRPRLLHGAVRVHLRPRDARRLPAPGRRLRAAHRGGAPGRAGRDRGRGRRDRAGDGPDGVQADPQRGQDRPARRGPGGRQRGGAHPARRPGSGSTTRSASRSSTASAAPSCCISSSRRPGTTSGRAPPAGRCPATGRRSSGPTARSSRPAPRGGSRSSGRSAAATWTTSASANYVIGGWNVTGDTFARDEDGYFYYRARTDNMIVSSGYNIGGPEVEAVIDSHPDVVESAVVGRPDADRGTGRVRVRRAAPGVVGDAAKARQLQDYVKAQLAPYKYPRDVRFTDALPRSATGKLQHFRLRAQVEAEASAAAADGPPGRTACPPGPERGIR